MPRAAADVPRHQISPECPRALASDRWLRSRADQFLEPLDPQPFSNEFYLHQFAADNDKQDSRWRFHLNPMLRNLSKRIAGWPHALVRIMP